MFQASDNYVSSRLLHLPFFFFKAGYCIKHKFTRDGDGRLQSRKLVLFTLESFISVSYVRCVTLAVLARYR